MMAPEAAHFIEAADALDAEPLNESGYHEGMSPRMKNAVRPFWTDDDADPTDLLRTIFHAATEPGRPGIRQAVSLWLRAQAMITEQTSRTTYGLSVRERDMLFDEELARMVRETVTGHNLS